MRHFKDPRFRPHYDALPEHVREAADRCFDLLKHDPKHPSLHFKRIRDDLWSVRIGRSYIVPSRWPAPTGCNGSGSARMPTTTG